MASKFSPLQPGVLKFTMAALAEQWPDWDDDADNDIDRSHGEPWPEREVVSAVVLRALSDAGFVKGVLRSDYADLLDPEKLAAVTTDRMHAVVGSTNHELLLRKYIRYVQEHEGAGYIVPVRPFTDEEYVELQRQEDLAYSEGEPDS